MAAPTSDETVDSSLGLFRIERFHNARKFSSFFHLVSVFFTPHRGDFALESTAMSNFLPMSFFKFYLNILVFRYRDSIESMHS